MRGIDICAGVDQLPLFPHNRGWEIQPNSRGLYTRESLAKWDLSQNKLELQNGLEVAGKRGRIDSGCQGV